MKNLILFALLVSPVVYAQGEGQTDAQAEAIMLNQELQFLEDSTRNISAAPSRADLAEETRISDTPRRSRETKDLERTYFGDEEADSIQTRTAAPKRRKFR